VKSNILEAAGLLQNWPMLENFFWLMTVRLILISKTFILLFILKPHTAKISLSNLKELQVYYLNLPV
jgi:hypothetical protein